MLLPVPSRFCQHKLPDWREALFPDLSPRAAPSRPVMAIHFGNQRFVMQVSLGIEGVNEPELHNVTVFASKLEHSLKAGPYHRLQLELSGRWGKRNQKVRRRRVQPCLAIHLKAQKVRHKREQNI
eukprot:scaffold184840_cov33-Tisochrysis_lutea.AAC.1